MDNEDLDIISLCSWILVSRKLASTLMPLQTTFLVISFTLTILSYSRLCHGANDSSIWHFDGEHNNFLMI